MFINISVENDDFDTTFAKHSRTLQNVLMAFGSISEIRALGAEVGYPSATNSANVRNISSFPQILRKEELLVKFDLHTADNEPSEFSQTSKKPWGECRGDAKNDSARGHACPLPKG